MALEPRRVLVSLWAVADELLQVSAASHLLPLPEAQERPGASLASVQTLTNRRKMRYRTGWLKYSKQRWL